uniref:Uncharacterized protein n=1 Tax=Spongospora subterranea TaxID=70186 RepID=A0A0H5QM87_9EUKA|eukprot:CRZ02491.1 hypothetical protein [Spongospora subterranea]
MTTRQWVSWALGYIDDIAIGAIRFFEGKTYFDGGVGDVGGLEKSEKLMKRVCLGEDSVPEMQNLVWNTTKKENNELRGPIIEEATFNAPFSDLVPDECKSAHFQLIRPAVGKVRGVVIHFQMTADETFSFRRNHIAGKLVSSGIASILLMAPLYGSRRPSDQERHYVRNISDLIQAGIVGIFEGVMLVNWCRAEFPDAQICLTGISAGAVPAAGTGLLSAGPVAVVPCIGAGSPQPFINGALSSHVNWESITKSLGKRDPNEARLYLTELFARVHLRRISDWRKEAGNPPSLVSISVAASNDRCVLPDESQELHNLLAGASSHEEMLWIIGGHATSIHKAGSQFVPIIERAIDILQQSNATVVDTPTLS